MPKIGLFVVLVLLATAGGMILASGPSQAVLKDGGDARLVGFQPLPQLEGPMCPEENTPTLLAAMIQPQQAPVRTTSSGDAAQVAKRPAARIIRDPSAAFSGIAIDLKHN